MDQITFYKNASIMLLIIGGITLVGNTLATDSGIFEAIPGMILILIIGFVGLGLGREIDIELPAFAYAIFIATILSLPMIPTQELFLEYTDRVGFLATTTPILAYAGLSVANQWDRLKNVGWKLILVAIFVFIGTFFGSAIIAHIVLDLQGII